MHMIKKITGGSSKHPTIEISFKDDSVLKSNYKIKCDLNKLYKKTKQYILFQIVILLVLN